MDQERKKGDNHFCYRINQRKIKGSFDILNNISEHVTLVQLMYIVGNVNHGVSIYGNWIFYTNDEKSLSLAR